MKLHTAATICLLLAVAAACTGSAAARRNKDPKECEVCVKVVSDIYGSVPAESKKDRDAIESAIGTYCKRAQSKGADRLGSKERKACYYMVDIKRKVADPLARGVPAQRVCKKLKKANSELCEMRFPVKVDKNTNYNKLRVKQLKMILRERGVDCKGCLEKRDYVKRVKETEHLEL